MRLGSVFHQASRPRRCGSGCPRPSVGASQVPRRIPHHPGGLMFLLRAHVGKAPATLLFASILFAACDDGSASGDHVDGAADSDAAPGCPATELTAALDQARAT